MRSITIKFRDGSKREFQHRGRPGGSYTISLTFDKGFAIVADEWGKQFVFPESLIQEIESEPFY